MEQAAYLNEISKKLRSILLACISPARFLLLPIPFPK